MHKPTDYQQALVNTLLRKEFQGAIELRKQALNFMVDDKGDESAGFMIMPSTSAEPAQVEGPVPIEGLVFDETKMPIEILLHVTDGYMNELEIVHYSDRIINPLDLDSIHVLTLNEREEYEKTGTLPKVT